MRFHHALTKSTNTADIPQSAYINGCSPCFGWPHTKYPARWEARLSSCLSTHAASAESKTHKHPEGQRPHWVGTRTSAELRLLSSRWVATSTPDALPPSLAPKYRRLSRLGLGTQTARRRGEAVRPSVTQRAHVAQMLPWPSSRAEMGQIDPTHDETSQGANE